MAAFNRGDRVVINGTLIATIETYDMDNDRISYVSVPPGGGTDTAYGHISQTRVEKLVSETVSEPAEPKKKAPAKAASGDEITTAGSL